MNTYKDYIRTEEGEVYAEIKYTHWHENQTESGFEECRIESCEVDQSVYDENEIEFVLKADMERLKKVLLRDWEHKQKHDWDNY